MTHAETAAFNAGVQTMRDVARRSADAIEGAGKRPLVEAFAVAALRQLAEDGAALLVKAEAAAPAQNSGVSAR